MIMGFSMSKMLLGTYADSESLAGIFCESSAQQIIHVKYQALFSWRKKFLNCHLLLSWKAH